MWRLVSRFGRSAPSFANVCATFSGDFALLPNFLQVCHDSFVEALEVVILIYETQEVPQTVQLLVLAKWREVEVNILQHDSAWSWAESLQTDYIE